MRFAALALGLLLVAAQDEDARIKELIRQLDDADFIARDEAWQALVKIGPKAVPFLKEAAETSPSAEVKLRAAEAVQAIELAVKAASVYREPRRITADFAGTPLAKALEEVARQAELRLEGAAHVPDAAVTLKLDGAPLFEALDRLCGPQQALSYELREGVIALLKERHAAPPAAYSGPFRVELAELTVTRKTDFKSTEVTAVLKIGADWEKYLKPLAKVRYEIAKAVDDTGAELKVSKPGEENAAMAGGAAFVVLMGGAQNSDLDRTFNLKGFGPAATGLRLLSGTARFQFPLQHSDVKFAAPTVGDRQDAGDFAFKIAALRAKHVEIEILRAKGNEAVEQEEIDRRLDAGSIVAVDADGTEHKAESLAPSGLDSIVVGPGGIERKLRYRVTFESLRVRDAKELRFRFVDKTLEKAAPFEFRDVRVP